LNNYLDRMHFRHFAAFPALVVALAIAPALVIAPALAVAQVSLASIPPPHVLIVDAHPDDEVAYAATTYKIVHDLHGTVDLVVITDGQGGYKYSTLAEPYYGLELTRESIGRKNLPEIRRKEMRAAGKILGISHIYFLNQRDNRYMLSAHEVLDSTIWDTAKVEKKLVSLMKKGDYDFVFTLLPVDSTHGHHKAASILALRAVSMLPAEHRPVILAGSTHTKGAREQSYNGLRDYPLTRPQSATPQFTFDRLQSFGYRHVLNYKIIVNWAIAEHKSQGTEQLDINRSDEEQYWLYAINADSAAIKTKQLFDALAVNHYPDLHYPGEIR
jgi:LmbE family N-acetylglucosaminyl deacetylase